MKIELSDIELSIIGKALGELPYRESAAVIASIQKQINESNSKDSIENEAHTSD